MSTDVKINPVALSIQIAVGAICWLIWGTLKSFVIGVLVMFIIGLILSVVTFHNGRVRF